jgi:hypothetical protein
MAAPQRKGRRTESRKRNAKGERVMLGLRVTPELKERLDDATRRSGRSQSQEAEFRLELSFEREDLLADALKLAVSGPTAGLVLALATAMNGAGYQASVEAGKPLREHWMNDPYSYEKAAQAAASIIEALRPEGDRTPPLTPGNFKNVLPAWNYGAMVLSAIDDPEATAEWDHFIVQMSKVTAGQIRSLLGPIAKIRAIKTR